ncbi:hypothetical protein ACFOQM_22325 [Paenibacillus sp. GCM10012307]|uniref:Uncharacterized protein n=1 Tax=Paenibacillus roseus TaxID=2798579 RepID=A0A934MSI5_9BACL|nr:hypothetical protein [Paenibacillus roseus]MBJ6363968.1 hypothetical protein [Paenibacillus roseus]
MKTKYNDFWLTKNTKPANAYMDEVAKESNFTGQHKGYTILPHKIHRCYGLSPYETISFGMAISFIRRWSKKC